MDIDPTVTEVTKDESHSIPELDAAGCSVDQVEEAVSEEKSQTGPTTASPCPPSPPTEKDSTTMGDEEVPGSQQTSHGSDPQEISPEGSDATVEEKLTKDDEEHDEEIIMETDSPPGETEEEQKETTKDKSQPTEKDIVVKPTRVVVRRLPPKINTKDFVTSVSPLPKYNYVQIDNPDPEWGQGARSVAHINFLDPEDALWFIDRFTGYQFFDEEGEAYISVCDFATSQKIFKSPSSSKRNPLRGKLKESEEYLAFLKNYKENPFQFVVGTRPREIVTAEVMLSEIEGKTKHIGPESTPLTQFILNNKSRREDDRKMRRDKDRERQRLEKARQLEKREKERVERAAATGKNKDSIKEISKERESKNMERSNREKYRDLDREHKKERKRERRDKERKERIEQEKLEKEASAKGMTVTFSKTGKATRWSANSSPFAKKGDPASADPNNEKESTTSSSQEKPISQDLSKPAFKELKQDKSKPPPREETTKRFSNPFVKHEAKKIEIPKEDKSKFGKPFPLKNETTTKTSSPLPPKESEKEKPKPTNISKPLEKKDSTGSGDTTENGGKPTEGQDGKGKKKIVKKIVRVRKVKTTKTGEDGEQIVETRVISRKPVPQTSSSATASSSSVKKVESNNNNKSEPPATDAVKEKSKEVGGGESCPSSAKTTSKDEGDRRRRARPEMQFYRPGSLRSAKDKDKNKVKDSETKVEK